MTAHYHCVWTLALLTVVLSACGREDASATGSSAAPTTEGEAVGAITSAPGAEPNTEPAASPTPETAPTLPVPTAAEPVAEETPRAASPEPIPGTALPVPAPPASWRVNVRELAVNGGAVHSLSSTCGLIATMPLVQAVVASTESCTERGETELSVVFERGRVMAIHTSGPDAQCVGAWVQQAHTNATCQVQLTFAD